MVAQPGIFPGINLGDRVTASFTDFSCGTGQRGSAYEHVANGNRAVSVGSELDRRVSAPQSAPMRTVAISSGCNQVVRHYSPGALVTH